MNILVLNCGSSSIKYKLFDMTTSQVVAQGGIEKVGLKDSFLKFTAKDGKKIVLEREIPEHTAGIKFIFEVLTSKEHGCLESLSQIDAVGHRLVHGGEAFSSSVVITDEVEKKVEECSVLAPLHNPANLKGVRAIKEILPNVKQVGVFDTAFHQTMPKEAFMYALPYEMYEKYGVRKYGFHGTSHRYVSRKACEILSLDYQKTKIITVHIGGGGSLTAIDGGVSVDTTMGLTPLDGLMMGTRSGSLDMGAAIFVAQQEGLSLDELSSLLNKKSGVLGISGISSDMRDIEAAIDNGDERAILAMKMYEYSIIKYIGAMTAALGGVDLLVFTGGVGENQTASRERICKRLAYLGLEFDDEANKARGVEALISTKNSKVKVLVVPTDEELMIAQDTLSLVK